MLLKAVQDIIALERELEQFKVSLAKCGDFNLIDAFGVIDKEGRGYVTASELHDVLTEFNLTVGLDDCRLLFQRYNREQDGAFKYSEFADAFFPFDIKHARLLGTKQLKYSQQPSKLSFEQETLAAYLKVWDKMVRTERAVEGVRCQLAKRVSFDLDQAFASCDNTYDGIVTQSDVSALASSHAQMKNLFVEYGLQLVTSEELSLFLNRLDRKKDGRISA